MSFFSQSIMLYKHNTDSYLISTQESLEYHLWVSGHQKPSTELMEVIKYFIEVFVFGLWQKYNAQ